MKIFKIFLPFQLVLEAVTQLLQSQNKGTNSSLQLIPVRVKETDRIAMIRAQEMQRRSNQGNNIL